jgi:hypothetical protein
VWNMDTRSFTTAPPGLDDSEFVDWRGLKSRFAIGRSLAYLLIEHDDIESKVLRRKGCIKGKRLFNVASVRQYIARQSGDVDPRLSANCRKAQIASASAKREKETK